LSFSFTNRLGNSVSQLSTSLELCNLLGSNLNLCLGSGVDTFASRALVYAERTEANESNLVTLYESLLNSSNCGIESLLCVNLADTCTSGNLLN